MSTFLGMDVEHAREHAERLAVGAERLEALGERLGARVREVAWTGPDADAFRQEALLGLVRLTAAAGRCRTQSSALLGEAAQQETTSAGDGSATVRIGGATVPSAFHRGLATGPYDDPHDGIAPLGPEHITRPDAEGLTAPRDLVDLLATLDTVARAQTDQATAIRVQEILGADGESRYIVYVPGSHGRMTNTLGPIDLDGNPMDWNQNPGALLGRETDSSQAVRAAMEAAGIPHGAEVVFAGHSQGGIVASNLAADPSVNGGPQGWRITDVITVGSPVELAPVPPTTNTLNFAHEPVAIPLPGSSPLGPAVSTAIGLPDVVPGLDGDPHDLWGTPSHRHEVELPTISYDIGDNHTIPRYQESVEHRLEHDPDGVAAAFQDSASMQNILGPGAALVDTADFSVSRAEGTYLDTEALAEWFAENWDPRDAIL